MVTYENKYLVNIRLKSVRIASLYNGQYTKYSEMAFIRNDFKQ